MNDCLIVYDSVYGHTRQYAAWLGAALGCPVKMRRDVKVDELAACRQIIYGGGLYAGAMRGTKRLLARIPSPQDKSIIVFTCGLADPGLAKTAADLRARLDQVIPSSLHGRVPVFHLRGGMDYARLHTGHRLAMWLLYRHIRRKAFADMTAEDRAFLASYGSTLRFLDRAALDPIVAAARHGQRPA